MLAMSETEIEEIDKQLEGTLQWAEQNTELAEQLAMDATRLMSCTNERLEDYKDKGFFNRCVSSFSGKTAKMQRDNQNDMVEMQKMGWRYLQILNERDILMAHSLITIKNNLETLAVKENETREEITRFAIKVKEKFDSHTKRLDELEVAVDIQQWLTTIEVQGYDERYPKHMRLLCLVRDFKSKKAQDWNMRNIQCLQQAIYNAKIDRKEKITLEQFVNNLIDEIEDYSFEMFSEITALNTYSIGDIDTSFLVEEIASPTFNSLYQISDNYTKSNMAVDTLIKHLNIEKKNAIKKIILGYIQSAGVDINKEIQLQDIALEILSCSKLAQELFAKKHSNTNTKIKDEKEPKNLEKIDNQLNETKQPTENIKLNTLSDLELSPMLKKFAVGDDFGLLIDNKGLVKSFGSNDNGCLGIGSKEREEYDNPANVIDLPKDRKCVSIDVGHRHSLALLENGSIYGWGYSHDGQLGDDTEENRLSPFKVIGLPKDIQPVKIVAGAESSVVLLENGDLYATGKIVDSLVFVPYKLDFKVQDVELLYDYSDNGLVLLKDDNKILIKNLGSSNLDWCDFDDNDFYRPKGLHEDSIVEKIITGSNYLFVLTKNNTLYGIGQNKDGQLGMDDHSGSVKSFSKIYGMEGEILEVVTSHESSYSFGEDEKHFTLIRTDKYIYGCGTNVKFQLGKQENYYETSREKDKSYAKNMAMGAGAGALGGFIGSGIGAVVGAVKTALEDTEYEYTKHYLEMKPKNIEELSNLINDTDNIEMACGNDVSYICNFTDSKLYKLGGSYSDEDIKIIDFNN